MFEGLNDSETARFEDYDDAIRCECQQVLPADVDCTAVIRIQRAGKNAGRDGGGGHYK